jgi:hypothetical protein
MSRIIAFWEDSFEKSDPLTTTPAEELEKEQLPAPCEVCGSPDGDGLLVTNNTVIPCPKCGVVFALLLFATTLCSQTYHFGTSSHDGVFYKVYPAYTTAFQYDSTTSTLYTLPPQGKRVKLDRVTPSDIMFKDEDYFVYELRGRVFYFFTRKYLTLCRYF